MGGRRKSSKKRLKPTTPAAFTLRPLPKHFDCPFCNYKKSVSCSIDHGKGFASLKCGEKGCGASFEHFNVTEVGPFRGSLDTHITASAEPAGRADRRLQRMDRQVRGTRDPCRGCSARGCAYSCHFCRGRRSRRAGAVTARYCCCCFSLPQEGSDDRPEEGLRILHEVDKFSAKIIHCFGA